MTFSLRFPTQSCCPWKHRAPYQAPWKCPACVSGRVHCGEHHSLRYWEGAGKTQHDLATARTASVSNHVLQEQTDVRPMPVPHLWEFQILADLPPPQQSGGRSPGRLAALWVSPRSPLWRLGACPWAPSLETLVPQPSQR